MRNKAMLGGVLAVVGAVAAALGGEDAALTTTYRLERRDAKALSEADSAATVSVLVRRLDGAGAAGVKIAADGTDTIRVSVPAEMASRREELLALAERPGTLEFRICASKEEEQRWRDVSAELEQPLLAPKRYRWLPIEKRGAYPGVLVVIPEQAVMAQLAKLRASGSPEDAPAMKALQAELESTLHEEVFTGEQLAKVELRRELRGNVVYFALREDRKKPFADFTKRHVSEQMAVIVDGKVLTAPVIDSPLPGEGVIAGGGASGFTADEARTLVSVLTSGTLPVRLVRVETPEKK